MVLNFLEIKISLHSKKTLVNLTKLLFMGGYVY